LGVTGLFPLTVNAGPASVGRADGVVAVAETRGGALRVAGMVVVIGAGPVGAGVVEHAASSAATAPTAPTTAAVRARPAI
jgi:hypothetical protein